MNNYNKILEDLRRTTPTNPTVLIPFCGPNDSPVQKTKSLCRNIRRARGRNDRRELLLNIFYLGELLEVFPETSVERTRCIRATTSHYKTVAVRVYYLFELLGAEQIYRTQDTTTTMVSKLTKVQYKELLREATTVAGARLREEEVVNM